MNKVKLEALLKYTCALKVQFMAQKINWEVSESLNVDINYCE